MSQWAKVGVAITDLDCFKRSCERKDVLYELAPAGMMWDRYQVHALLKDKIGGSIAYLIKDGGGFRVALDTDAYYSTLTKRLGPNGGRLTRDYAEEAVRLGARNAGAMVTMYNEQPDGSVVMKIAAVG